MVQDDVLTRYPQARIKVYAVWFNMLPGDSRGGWDSSLLPDARVTHFWDGQRQVGQWYSRQEGEQGVVWDAYRLYGPSATWTAAPTPLLSQGGPVVAEKAQLLTALGPLLTP